MMTKLSTTDTQATPKYMYVGQTFEFLAQAVRDMVPVGVDTLRNMSRVVRNLWSVRVMGMRTAMEIKRARIRETIRRWRMRALSF